MDNKHITSSVYMYVVIYTEMVLRKIDNIGGKKYLLIYSMSHHYLKKWYDPYLLYKK